jgi:hypothetical protein
MTVNSLDNENCFSYVKRTLCWTFIFLWKQKHCLGNLDLKIVFDIFLSLSQFGFNNFEFLVSYSSVSGVFIFIIFNLQLI